MVEPRLVEYLADDASIAARVGSGSPAVYRIYPEILPQEPTLPAITYTRVSSTHEELLDGTGPDLAFGVFQISCWAKTSKAASELAALVRMRMQGTGGDEFQKAGVLDERSDYESDTKLFRHDLDIRIAYAESSPS